MLKPNSLLTGWRYYLILSIVMGVLTLLEDKISYLVNVVLTIDIDMEKILTLLNVILLLVSPAVVVVCRCIDRMISDPTSCMLMHPMDYWDVTHRNSSRMHPHHFHRKHHYR